MTAATMLSFWCNVTHKINKVVFTLSHFQPFSVISVWFAYFFVQIDHSKATQTLKFSVFSSLEFRYPVPFFRTMWSQSSSGLLVIIPAPHTRLLQHRFPCHNPSHWCLTQKRDDDDVPVQGKNMRCSWIFISDSQGCTEMPKYVWRF